MPGATPAVRILPKSRAVGTALNTPVDPDAEYGHKGVGYHVQIAETCNNGAVTELLVDYTVNGASRPDCGEMQASLQRLKVASLLPGVLYADQGYTQGSAFLDAEAMGVVLHAPARTERLSPDSIGRYAFETDPTTGRFVTCPEGHPIKGYTTRQKRKDEGPTPVALIAREHCEGCPKLARCVATLPPKKEGQRGGDAYVQDLPRLLARDLALLRQRDPTWWDRYRIRRGIEATNSELKRKYGLGRLRVRRLARVQVAVGMKLASCNVMRWLTTPPSGPARPPDWRSRPRTRRPRKVSVGTAPG